ncbi:MAG: hypothetical protein Q9163_003560 [Psora crenata]
MGSQKGSKPNQEAEVESKESSQSQEERNSPGQQRDYGAGTADVTKYSPLEDIEGKNDQKGTPQPNKPWYGGSWYLGNKPKESKTAVAAATSETAAYAPAQNPSSSSTPSKISPAYQRLGSSSRSLPLAATTTRLNITSDTSIPTNGITKPGRSKRQDIAESKEPSTGHTTAEESEAALSNGDGTLRPTQNGTEPISDHGHQLTEEPKTTQDSIGWLTWFSKPQPTNALQSSNTESDEPTDKLSEAGNNQRNNIPEMGGSSPALPKQRRNSEPVPASPLEENQGNPRTWLYLWGKPTTHAKSGSVSTMGGNAENANEELEISNPRQVPGKDKPVVKSTSRLSPETAEPPKATGWAFWSKDAGSEKPGGGEGQLASARSASPSKPEKDTIHNIKRLSNTTGKEQIRQPQQVAEDMKKPPSAANTLGKGENSSSPVGTTSGLPGNKRLVGKKKKESQNLLLPSFRGTYQPVSKSGLIQQLSRWFSFASFARDKHVGIVSTPPRINRALVIGVHGYFPAPLVRSLLGQPTGTSIRFADGAASAIQKWTQIQGYSCEVEKVALEGEGKIAERVELLWKLMLEWTDKIRKADFIMVACHSQGCPVALMLVAKLISFGCVSSARIGVCAMAGVNLGPFVDYKSRWIGGTAGELFDFARPDSKVSKDYEAALDIVLRFGVKVVYVGSIDDQLVSLESSTFGPIIHPYIYRAAWIDGRVYAPDFLTHLVGFALKLRNLGISDHGLIRELSTPLAGSLYSGEGHSRIYEDESVYYLAVQFALETTTLGSMPMQVQRQDVGPSRNPYILPYVMRGLLEEEYVRTGLYGEIFELLRQFDDWTPSTKMLKDVKFRLEGVRSKL